MVARIRKTKPVVEEPRKISVKNDTPTMQADIGYENTVTDQGTSRFIH